LEFCYSPQFRKLAEDMEAEEDTTGAITVGTMEDTAAIVVVTMATVITGVIIGVTHISGGLRHGDGLITSGGRMQAGPMIPMWGGLIWDGLTTRLW
jgi:hypothetical protein